MDKKVIKNYLYNTSYQLMLIILPLITTPYVSRVLGANGLGTYNYTNSITQYFILFGCIGLNLYGQREIAYYQNDITKRNRTFYELVLLRFITVLTSIVIFYFTLVRNSEYAVIFGIQLLDLFASLVDVSWFFQGLEDFKKIVLRNFVVRMICVALIFLLVKTPEDLNLYVLCYSITLFLGNLSLWLYLPKYISLKDLNNLDFLRHIRPALVLFLPQIASSIYTLLDKTMIGFITTNNSEVAFYTQSQVLIKTVLALLTSLGTVMLPRIASLFKQNEMEKIKENLNSSFKFTFFLSFPMMFGLMAVSSNLVPWFFGPGYEKVVPNMIVISPILVFIGLSNIMGNQFLLPLGRQKEFTTSIITGMVINLCLNLILIPRFSSIGAAIATVVAECGVVLAQIYFIKDQFNFMAIIKDNGKYILSGLVMMIITAVLSVNLSATFINTLLCVGVGICVYFALLIALKDTFVVSFIKKILASKM